LWAAAAPGAGFAETAEYLKLGANEPMPPEYEQKLWRLNDATSYAGNLFNLPIVAYSGEIDRQKQAADVMAREMKKDGLELVHIIGPKTEHKYHPDSIPEINRRIDAIVAKGRNPIPRQVKFTTYTLRYNQMFWVKVDGLEQHWEKATVEAEIKDAKTIEVKTKNVSVFTLEMPSGLCPLDVANKPTVIIDGEKIEATAVQSDRSWDVSFQKVNNFWSVIPVIDTQHAFAFTPAPLRSLIEGHLKRIHPVIAPSIIVKQHGLQGPIDDAFMDRFIFVRPTGKSANEAINNWVHTEMNRAVTQWRALFRGETIVKNDDEISVEDVVNSHLILWGDTTSNKLLELIATALPIKWTAEKIHLGKQTYSSSNHIPILIYPNPLNPNRYVVLNSGFTFREADHLSNARQNPKLPDWAIVDITTAPSPRSVGKIANAGFFGERWELR
jgi:hypothetical protein